MTYIKHQVSLKQYLCICFFGLLLNNTILAQELTQEPQRHICKDSHAENYFSFIPPEGWSAINLDKLSGRNKNKLYHLSEWLNGLPQGGNTVSVCYQTGKSYIQQPLIFIYRAYNMDGTGSELETKWLSEKYQKQKRKDLYDREALVTDNAYVKDRFPTVDVDDIQIFNAHYDYRQDIHTAFEKVEGTLHGKEFVRITATILGGLNHAAVFCHYEGPNRQKAAGLIDQIVNSFEFEADNVFGRPLEQQGQKGLDFGQKLTIVRGIVLLYAPIAIGGALGIWLSARDCGLECQFYKALLIGTVSPLIFILPPYKFFISLILYFITTYGLLALFIRDNYYDDLPKVTGCAALGALFGTITLWIYIVFQLMPT
ncbi:MAG: hypothetical protein ACYSOD_06375 [Planctomycetota bacterium]|jgi:hypothetical protein